MGNRAQGSLELGAAIATQAEKRVASQAFGMDPRQHRFIRRHVPQGQHYVLLVRRDVLKAMHGKDAPVGRETRSFNKTYGHSRHRVKKGAPVYQSRGREAQEAEPTSAL